MRRSKQEPNKLILSSENLRKVTAEIIDLGFPYHASESRLINLTWLGEWYSEIEALRAELDRFVAIAPRNDDST
jgi:hypothetical protein